MKKINFIKAATILLLSIVFFACSIDRLEDENAELETSIETFERGGDLNNPLCDKRYTMEVIAEYDFPQTVLPDGQIITITNEQKQTIKEDYRAEMSQYFTICKIIDSNCDDVEKWIVNKTEYLNYTNSVYYGNGSNSSQSSGTLKDPDTYIGNCFL